MALTASATPLYAFTAVAGGGYLTFVACRVQDDISRILRMTPDRLVKFVHPFNRPNLFYEVCCVLETVFLTLIGSVYLGSVPLIRGDYPNGRDLELHQRPASSTGTTIFRDHLLSDSHDM
jgi:hypothetical protein